MKTKLQYTALVLSLLVTVGAASGCGSSSKSTNYDMAPASSAAAYAMEEGYDTMEYAAEAPMEAPMEAAPQMAAGRTAASADSASADGGSAASPQMQDRKLVRRANLEMEAEEFDKSLAAILTMVNEQGGYIESQQVSGSSITARYSDLRWASIQARIPAEKLDAALSGAESITNVISKSENVEDISDTYFDSDARLNSLKLQEDRLLAILEKAEKLEDVITLEQSLSQVRYEIESLTASLRRMDGQVQYSYLTMQLQEVQKYTEVVDTPRTFGDKLADAFRISGKRVTNLSESFLLGTIENLPAILLGLLFWGILIWIVFVFVRFILKKAGVTGKSKGEKKSAVQPVTDSAYIPVLSKEPENQQQDTKQE